MAPSRALLALVCSATAMLVGSCRTQRAAQPELRKCASVDCKGPAYPRIASYRIETTFDDEARAMLRRVSLAIVEAEAHALHPTELPGVRRDNPTIDLLAYLTSEELPRIPDPTEHPLADERFGRVPSVYWLTEPGSLTTREVTAEATRIPVEDPHAFTLTRPESSFYPEDEPTYLLFGDEHVKLVAIEGDELVVERGFRSTAATHAAGTPIAAHVVFFEATWMLDLASTAPADREGERWRDMLARDAIELTKGGPFNGVFLDVCLSDLGFLNGGLLDVDRDGKRDDIREAAQRWNEGFSLLVGALRRELGESTPIIANPGAQDCPHPELDGILLEGWPIGMPEKFLPFETGFDRYFEWSMRPHRRSLTVANAFSPKIGFGTIQPGQDVVARTDYAAMRFGLTAALLGDGYAAYDNGVFGHYVAWWYDEYDGAGRGVGWLGYPIGDPVRQPSGIWSREYQHGLAIVNPTDRAQSARVPDGFVKLAGQQDPAHNDGAEVEDEIVVAPRDGYLLVRR